MSGLTIIRRGLMLVLSSPSGAGKTTLSRLLLETEPKLTISVSVTTRPPRPGEQDGRDYYFITPQRFDELAASDELLEYATVFGHQYGTLREPVGNALAQGRDVLFDIDWQGTQQLATKAGDDVVSVFILPPGAAELEERLRRRAQDPPEVVASRMSKAADEISHWREYDYIIVNDDLDNSLQRIRAILTAERLRRNRQIGLIAFVKELQSQL